MFPWSAQTAKREQTASAKTQKEDHMLETMNIPRTISKKEIDNFSSTIPSQIWEFFVTVPIDKCRDRALDMLAQAGNNIKNEEIESAILGLVKVKDEYWKKLLNWYLFVWPIQTFRPIEFAFECASLAGSFWLKQSNFDEVPWLRGLSFPHLIKEINNWLKKNRGTSGELDFSCYWEFAEREKLFARILKYFSNGMPAVKIDQYNNDEWLILERVSELAVQYKDYTQLPLLQKILEEMKKGKFAPDRDLFKGITDQAKHQAHFQCIVDELQKINTDPFVFCAKVGEILSEKLGLKKKLPAHIDIDITAGTYCLKIMTDPKHKDWDRIKRFMRSVKVRSIFYLPPNNVRNCEDYRGELMLEDQSVWEARPWENQPRAIFLTLTVKIEDETVEYCQRF